MSTNDEASSLNLISAARLGCSDSFIAIDRSYGDLFYKICHKYRFALEKNGVSFDEVLEEKYNLLFKCVRSFNPDKGSKFSTWVANQAKYLCLNKLAKFKNHLKEENFNFDTLPALPSINETDFEMVKVARGFIDNLEDRRAVDIFKLRYGADRKNLCWKNVGKKLKISSVTARKIHNKTLSLLKAKIKSC